MRTMDNVFLYNEGCPRCQKLGNDKAGDNFAIFSDGHAHCWSCGFYRVPAAWTGHVVHTHPKPVKISLPEDCDFNYTQQAIDFMGQYGFTHKEMLSNKILFSRTGVYINLKKEKTACNDLLIFPFWNKMELLGWIGRYFGVVPGIPKWITRGRMQEIYHIIPGNSSRTIVLTEALISAIKVGKAGHEVMSILGSHAKGRFKHLKLLGYRNVILWMDPDKHMEMIKQSRAGSLEGLEMRVILSEKKPKDYTIDEIKEYLK